MSGKKWGIILIILGLLLGACSGNEEFDSSGEPVIAEPENSANKLVANDAALPPIVQVQSTDRMIVKNGMLVLQVDDTNSALTQVTNLAAEYGGYVISSERSDYGYSKSAAIMVAVEAEQFEAAMNAMRAVGEKVLQDSATGEDVTAEYVDLESRLRGLEATRDRILSFLDRAQTAEEALNVNAQLTEIETQIEQVKGRMNYLEGRAAYSTISVNLREDVPPDTETDKWSPRETLEDAIDAQIELVESLSKGAIWIIIVLGPYLLIAGIILLITRRWLVRRRAVSHPQAE